jgi:drug/metabolite transporter (DMT)-like permease
MGAVIFGLASALSWGGGDFSGGLAARRANVFTVLIFSQIAGLVLVLAFAWSETFPPPRDLAWGFAAGLSGAVGLAAMYRAMAVGRIGIVSPITAVLSAAFPVLFAALTEGLPGSAPMLGFALGAAGLWLVSNPQDVTASPAGLELAILGGLGFGGFYVLIGQVQTDTVFWILAAARAASISLMSGLAWASGRMQRPTGRLLPLLVLAGLLDVGGNAFFVLAVQAGRLDVSSVLSSLYPAITVLLARTILKEHVTRAQAVGILAALVAVPLIAA